MSSKDYGIDMLLDFYSELLSPSQKQCLELYYAEDLSLSEISENIGITRQGALNNIKKGELLLRQYEEKLKMAQSFIEAERKLEDISECIENMKFKIPNCSSELEELKQKIKKLLI